MKKITALLLCLLMCLSLMLVGCEKDEDEIVKELEKLAGKTPEELYAASLEALKVAESFECTSAQTIEMSAQGESLTINQKVISKQNGYDMYAKTENDMAPAAEIELTYVDGVLYLVQNGTKTKQTISHEQLDAAYESLYGTSMSEATLLNIPEDWFEDITFKKDDDYYTLTFVVSGDKYSALVENAGLSGGTFTTDVEYVVYFTEDGTLEKVVASFDMDVMGVEARCVSTTTVRIGGVTITAPADADSYK